MPVTPENSGIKIATTASAYSVEKYIIIAWNEAKLEFAPKSFCFQSRILPFPRHALRSSDWGLSEGMEGASTLRLPSWDFLLIPLARYLARARSWLFSRGGSLAWGQRILCVRH